MAGIVGHCRDELVLAPYVQTESEILSAQTGQFPCDQRDDECGTFLSGRTSFKRLISMFHFSIDLTVAEEDVNYRNHASFDKYLVFFHKARIAYLAALGYHFDGKTINPGVIATEAHCTYRKEIRLGDGITVECRIREIRQKSLVMEFFDCSQRSDLRRRVGDVFTF